ncbi:hypothetical protein DSC45_02705 [Streptomyces sp. YIM 130001]|uniref:hypothetical protein n=1 Tax=Streptomyces sp. YIM 130001 TaxID=2259644 RepID=UPI000E64DC49|nr:hypothetical protein [Streptomyces sp. YIM 130001]RII20731.1 hypothetical protein DSC45_02705 [Streptomyces sp. YIM 130001]
MRLKRVGRLGTAAAVVASALGASIILNPSTASAESAWECYGKAVKRCATVWWDEAADTYRARAKITDVAGGANYSVKVTDVKLQNFNGTKWVTVRTKKDNDGWHATQDLAGTNTVDPCKYKNASFGVVAKFSWKKGSKVSNKTWRPDTGWAMMCD